MLSFKSFSEEFWKFFRSHSDKLADRKWEDHQEGHPGGQPKECEWCDAEKEVTDRWKGK